MSLDIRLSCADNTANAPEAIFIRRDGQTVEITRKEWDRLYPDQEPVVVEVEDRQVYSANITHNLGKMAEVAGVYFYLWRPEKVGVKKAADLVEPLARAIDAMEKDPDRFRRFDASNGWGTYKDFLPWLQRLLQACLAYPGADVTVWR